MKTGLLALLVLSLPAVAEEAVPAHPQIELETTEGTLLLELDGRRAPLTVRNFLKLVDDGFYDGTIFHRVIPDFMIQAGGYTRDLKLKEPEGGIPNESGNGLPNLRGTVAMARRNEPHTAMSQFFINVGDNKSLNPSSTRWGYAVFGYVIEGMDIADKIAGAPSGPAGPLSQDVPIAPIIILKARRL
ncbi:MAG: peptidyl-prolyl cis-trans isomerase [Woeseia sp.]|nr:peptidylprolyl isomerase [Woeseia sp.]MBT8095896.1 peptidylprolyl isomerase [Woeseia sp.]NNE59834.1 peptidyl-prolyl cis-trans isomerase [Woeseia sp.]NNL54260.1 peptidyl-prolyl cis-trans isomerase [Woeseia sp.]